MIQAVAPQIKTGIPTKEEREQLKACYQKSFDFLTSIAPKEAGQPLRVAVAALGIGTYHYPPHLASEVAGEALGEWVKTNKESQTKIEITFYFYHSNENDPTTQLAQASMNQTIESLKNN